MALATTNDRTNLCSRCPARPGGEPPPFAKIMRKKANQVDFIEFPAKSVASVAKAKAFYAETFGWSFQDWGDDYADTSSSGVGSGFNADPEHRPTKPLVVIYTPDLDEARTKVVSAGGKITKDVFSFPGGKRFHFADPCGNELSVWSDR
jgi:uncharacterized protein